MSSNSKSKTLPTILFKTNFRNTIYDVMSSRPGWKETDSETEWDIRWAEVAWVREVMDNLHLDEAQKVNHFRNHYELTRKDFLIKNVKRMKTALKRSESPEQAKLYDFCPTSFVLPQEYGMFVEEFKKSKNKLWIMKPVGKAQGKGIFLFTKLSEIADWKKGSTWKADEPQAETYIVQRYIHNPYLVGGKKFDMRIYALVTSYAPLTVWLYRSGFCRFTNTRYSQHVNGTDNLFMHLTNVAIQKKADDYDKEKDTKLDMMDLKIFMTSKHGSETTEKLFYEFEAIIIRSLLAVQKIMINDKHCFELYGYDIMFDDELKPWLIESNSSPAMTASSAQDYELKNGLLNDVFNVLDLEGVRDGDETRVGGFDLIWSNGPVDTSESSGGYKKTTLGCVNDRTKHLKKTFSKLKRGTTARKK